ncbi:hypothetical protein EVA_09341 [gut metagenome]|uniref:Uncharacterized protein n=1 Tax=gut metagenome TaxID=749906 RepID=J9G6T3_9ZZZZ
MENGLSPYNFRFMTQSTNSERTSVDGFVQRQNYTFCSARLFFQIVQLIFAFCSNNTNDSTGSGTG